MNGLEGSDVLRPDDRHIADLMVQAAAGFDVEQEMIGAFKGRN